MYNVEIINLYTNSTSTLYLWLLIILEQNADYVSTVAAGPLVYQIATTREQTLTIVNTSESSNIIIPQIGLIKNVISLTKVHFQYW